MFPYFCGSQNPPRQNESKLPGFKSLWQKNHSLTYFMIFLIAFPRVLDLSSDLGYIFFWLFF